MILLILVFMLVVSSQSENSRNEPSSWVVQKQRDDSGRTFDDWCREKASLSPETKHTVEVLLEKAGTTECEAADRQLSLLTELTLYNNQISDIKPLASLTNLTALDLDKNQISDIKPPAPTSPITQTRLTSRHDLDRIAEKLAVPSQSHPLAGFWKDECSDDFGLAIAPAGKGLYSISFCGPGGCFVPGTYRPNSPIVGDPSYRVVNNNTIDVDGRNGFARSIRCPSR